MKHSDGILMLWCCFAPRGAGDLETIAEYQEILAWFTHPMANFGWIGPLRKCNVPKHALRNTKITSVAHVFKWFVLTEIQ